MSFVIILMATALVIIFITELIRYYISPSNNRYQSSEAIGGLFAPLIMWILFLILLSSAYSQRPIPKYEIGNWIIWIIPIGMITLVLTFAYLWLQIEACKLIRAKSTGMMHGIYYRMEPGADLMIVKTWFLKDANDYLNQIGKGTMNGPNFLDHNDFKKITGMDFDSSKLYIKPSLPDIMQSPHYTNQGIKSDI